MVKEGGILWLTLQVKQPLCLRLSVPENWTDLSNIKYINIHSSQSWLCSSMGILFTRFKLSICSPLLLQFSSSEIFLDLEHYFILLWSIHSPLPFLRLPLAFSLIFSLLFIHCLKLVIQNASLISSFGAFRIEKEWEEL